MKSKQLPDDLCDWLKAQTLVIGAVTSLEPSSREPVHRATAQGEETVSAAIYKVRWHPQMDQARAAFGIGGPRPAMPSDVEEPLTAAQRLDLFRSATRARQARFLSHARGWRHLPFPAGFQHPVNFQAALESTSRTLRKA
jgi:hypothetical protein